MTDQRSAIFLSSDELVLRFPRGDFTDTCIRGLVASKTGSRCEKVYVEPWAPERIAAWHVKKGRYDRFGRHITRVIYWTLRSPKGNGLVQRTAHRLGIPLYEPAKSPSYMENVTINGRGWLDTEGSVGVWMQS